MPILGHHVFPVGSVTLGWLFTGESSRRTSMCLQAAMFRCRGVGVLDPYYFGPYAATVGADFALMSGSVRPRWSQLLKDYQLTKGMKKMMWVVNVFLRFESNRKFLRCIQRALRVNTL